MFEQDREFCYSVALDKSCETIAGPHKLFMSGTGYNSEKELFCRGMDSHHRSVAEIRVQGEKMMSFSNKGPVRYAWIGWVVLFLVTAAVITAGSERSVVINYRLAALDWLAGRGLYNFNGVGGFVYLPQAAMLFIPFAMLPPVAGEVLWRLFTIAIFAVSLSRFAILAGERTGKTLFPLMSLAAIPLVWDCARNGQSTLIMTAMMLLAVIDVARCRWWRATLWLVLGVAFKPLAIVLVLLIMAIDRPMTWRVGLALAATALAPFALQHPGYVLDQYSSFLQNSRIAAHVAVVAHGWSSPFNALQLMGIHVPERVQTGVRLAAAFATLALCGLTRRRHDAARSAVFVFSLATAYIILFSPRTEENTYMMLGPSLALFLAQAFLIEKRTGEGALLTGIALAIVGSRLTEHLLTPHAGTGWLSPLMATCFLVYLLVRLFTVRHEDDGNDVLPAGRQTAC